jgi:hypothetical protein
VGCLVSGTVQTFLKWCCCVLTVKRIADYPQALVRKLIGSVRSKKRLHMKNFFFKTMEQARNESNFISHLNMYQDAHQGFLSFGFVFIL